MQTTLLPAVDADMPTLANLTQLYLHDCSSFSELDVDERGCFHDPHLDQCRQAQHCKPFLIRVGRQLAGFALVDRDSRLHTAFDGYAVVAFFVLRKYRDAGVGRAAAIQLFNSFPGRWEVATFALNIPALAFWRSVIDSYTNGRYNEQWQQTADWRGHIQSFTTLALE